MAHHAQHAARAARSLQAAKARRILGLAAVVGAGAVAPGIAHADTADLSDAAGLLNALNGAGSMAAMPAAVPDAVPMATGAPAASPADLMPLPALQPMDRAQPVGALAGAQTGVGQAGGLHLYPLAGTPLDLLSNNVRVPVGGMDVSTFPITAPFRDGLPLGEVPVVGSLLP